jgi:hypothetical protein
MKEQARLIIRKDLERRGLLQVKQKEQHAQDGRLTN